MPGNGELRAIKLCSLVRNDCKAAGPNPRRMIFTATFFGTPQAYTVEMPEQFRRRPPDDAHDRLTIS